jgi:poly(hydroxyalkanoate) depolymerase family esterase
MAHAKFVLYVPKAKLQKPAPLFVVLHGFSSSATDIANITRFSQRAEQEGFFVLYPESEDPNIWSKCWQYFLPEQQIAGQGEGSMIIQEIDRIKANYSIDPNQVFLVGMSAGASLASILTSCYPNAFNGVAFHSGTSYGLSSTWKEALIDLKAGPSVVRMANTACNPKDFKGKVFVIQGSLDDLVNIKHFDRYANDYLSNFQNEAEIIEESPERFSYSKKAYLKNGKIFGESYFVNGLIHTWSGGAADGKDRDNNPTKKGPDATDLIIKFFMSLE